MTVTTMTTHDAGNRRRARRAQKLPSEIVPVAGDLAEQQPGDQEPGEHEEHVDTDEATGEPGDPGVEQHDDDHGDGAQALDVGPELVVDGCARFRHRSLLRTQQ